MCDTTGHFIQQTNTPEMQGLKPTRGNQNVQQRDSYIYLEYYHCCKIMANITEIDYTVAMFIFTTAETLNQD